MGHQEEWTVETLKARKKKMPVFGGILGMVDFPFVGLQWETGLVNDVLSDAVLQPAVEQLKQVHSLIETSKKKFGSPISKTMQQETFFKTYNRCISYLMHYVMIIFCTLKKN